MHRRKLALATVQSLSEGIPNKVYDTGIRNPSMERFGILAALDVIVFPFLTGLLIFTGLLTIPPSPSVFILLCKN